MKKYLLLPLFGLLLLSVSCIQDDFVDDFVEPTLRITSQVDSIELNTSFQLEYMYLNNVGQVITVPAIWESSDPSIISIDNNGLAQALQTGSASISVNVDNGTNTLQDVINVGVSNNTTVVTPQTRTGTIQTTSSYRLSGDFELRTEGNDLILEFSDDYVASSSLPGLYIYLTNNPNTTNGAYEIGKVSTFSGAHSYTIPNIGLNDNSHVLYFCKPFNVKVGDGEIQ